MKTINSATRPALIMGMVKTRECFTDFNIWF